MRVKYLLFFVAIFIVLSFLTFQVVSTGKKQTSKKVDISEHKERLEKYLQKALNLPSHISIKIDGIEDTGVATLKKLKVKFEDKNNRMSQTSEYVITNDYKYIILGQLLNTEEDPYVEKMKKIEISGRPTKGNKNAKVTMVVYSNFQCPYCARMVQIEEEILKAYPDKVKIIFKNFPLEFHQWAKDAGTWSFCLFRQDEKKFWKLHNYLFQKQQEITKENLREKIVEFCKNENVDISLLQDCYDNKLVEDILSRDKEEASKIGVRSVPTSIIQGRTIIGAQPIATFKEVIDSILKE